MKKLLVSLSVLLLSLGFAQECEASFRAVETAFDAVCIPKNPERIVALDEGTMADLLALGVKPLAVMDYGNRDYTQYLAVGPAEIASVGTSEGPNYEAMLKLNPDLIVGRGRDLEFFGENALESLQAVAPTALSASEEDADWQIHLRFLGEVVNKEPRAADLISSFETRLREFRTAYAAKGEDATIAIIRSRPDAFNVYAKESFIAETVRAAGLRMPGALYDLETRNQISLEEIDLLSSDHLFVMARNEDEAEAFLDAKAGPLWQFLPAVQKDQTYQVNWSTWVAGWNVVGVHLVLDDLFYYLLGGASSTPNPLQDFIKDEYGPEYDVRRFSEN